MAFGLELNSDVVDTICIVIATLIMVFLMYKIFVVREKFTSLAEMLLSDVDRTILTGYNYDRNEYPNLSLEEPLILGTASLHTRGDNIRSAVKTNPNVFAMPKPCAVNPYRPSAAELSRL